MKLSIFIIVGLISINMRTCMTSETTEDYDVSKFGYEPNTPYISHESGGPQKKIQTLMVGTDGRNGPPSIDHQCQLGAYPNCQGD
ncbi:hypothetical protein QOZ80_4AG0326000 [Eleusine coracana subsp. coracana]|nr:hypothetical protein QOZ80_4AG0326000 [Eleusine coracana subsp. coracana]